MYLCYRFQVTFSSGTVVEASAVGVGLINVQIFIGGVIHNYETTGMSSFEFVLTHWPPGDAAFAKLFSSTSANNSILASVQYIFIQKILPPHQPLSN